MYHLCLDFRDKIVREDYTALCVEGSYGPSYYSRLQIRLIDKRGSLYGIASEGYMTMQNLKFEKKFTNRVYVSDVIRLIEGAVKAHAKLGQMTADRLFIPFSQLKIDSLRPRPQGREIEICLWYIIEIEEIERQKEFWWSQAMNV